MIEELTRYWWVIGLRGVVAVLFALAAFFWAGITLTVLVLVFGAYPLVDGISPLSRPFVPRRRSNAGGYYCWRV